MVEGRSENSGPPVWRRLFHLTVGSVIPVVGIFAAELVMVIGLALLTVGGFALDLARFRLDWLNRRYLRWFSPILKTDESHRITGATYMLLAALVVFGLFGRTTAVASMLFLSLGDPVAALVGVRMPGPRIFGKSPGGTAAFVVVTWIVVGVLVVSGVTEFHRGLLIGGVVAALVELVPTRLDDNLTVPIAAGLAMHFLGV